MASLERDGGIEIHWEERGSGPLVVLAPYCISYPSVFDPLEAELADLAARRIQAGDWPWSFYCYAE